jgi:DNA polymerase-3 subunit delta'
MGFSEIIGQDRVLRLLRQALQHGRLPHALLFAGLDGVGKRRTALALAKVLNCESASSDDSCDRCLSCRKMASGNHPDLVVVEREGQFIRIDRIRDIQRRLRFRPLEGRKRVVLIHEAETMRTEAGNALLKILEEPPPNNLFILTAPDSTALLPTIASRCLCLRFQALTRAAIAAHLTGVHGVPPERADLVAALAGGSLFRALALLDEEELNRRRQLLETMARIRDVAPTEVLAAAERWSGDKGDLSEDLEWAKMWARDLLVTHLEAGGTETLINQDLSGELAAVTARFDPQDLPRLFDTLCALQGALRHQHLNKRSSLEALFFALRAGTEKDSPWHEPLLPALEREPFVRVVHG